MRLRLVVRDFEEGAVLEQADANAIRTPRPAPNVFVRPIVLLAVVPAALGLRLTSKICVSPLRCVASRNSSYSPRRSLPIRQSLPVKYRACVAKFPDFCVM